MTVTFDLSGLIVFGLGVWLLMDGMVFGLMPKAVRRFLRQMDAITEMELRYAGLVCAIFGAGIVFLSVWFARSL